jgi:Fic family protein
MAGYSSFRWESQFDGPTRRERRTCDYRAYFPDPLGGRSWQLAGDVAADIADAEMETARFNARPSPLSDTEGLARLLLRAEAVASSRIEGLEAGPRRVLRAEAAERMGAASLDVTADEILANIRAMQLALDYALSDPAVTVETLRNIHFELMRRTRMAEHAGKLRREQNWIGGNSYNPCGAAYVPPPPEAVPALMEDLCEFCSTDDLSPLAQAAIAHAQFETIHPFADGNGRTGRALIHLILRRRGLATRFVPPISLVLATWSKTYVNGLTRFRHEGSPDSTEATVAVNEWLGSFAAATRRAIADSTSYEERLGEIRQEWLALVRPLRAGSAASLLIDALPATPVVTVTTAADFIGRSFEATNQAVQRLMEAGILQPITVGRRNRAFEAPDIIDALVGLERRLASPEGDTRVSPPVRPAPRPRQRPGQGAKNLE